MTLRSEAKAELKGFIERIERLAAERRENGDDQKAIFAEAKSAGFDVKIMRKIIKRRDADPHELAEEETIFAVYMEALGMREAHPLHEQVAALVADELGREEVIGALQALVPANGEIIAKIGGKPVRVWRGETGEAFAAEYVEPVAPAPKPGKSLGRSATVLSIVPGDPVKAAADRAEQRSKGKAPAADETETSDDEAPVE